MRYAKRLYHLLKRKWQRKKSLPYSIKPDVELYDSLRTLIINNWQEIRETGNILLLLKSKIQDPPNKLIRYCLDTWDSIRNEEITKFDTLNKEYFRALAKVALIKIDYAKSQTNMDKLRLELAQGELSSLTQNEEPASISETKFILQKADIDINLRKDSVEDFYTAINYFKKTVSNGK